MKRFLILLMFGLSLNSVHAGKRERDNQDLINDNNKVVKVDEDQSIVSDQNEQATDIPEVCENQDFIGDSVADKDDFEDSEFYSDEEFYDKDQDPVIRTGEVFSRATNNAQYVAQLKQIIYNEVDITKNLDQDFFDRLAARAPTNFSMLMNREIGRASTYDIMQHNFSESHMTSYAHYFPECMIKKDVPCTTFEGHKDCVYCITQLSDGSLASASRDNTIRVWDLNTNTCVATLEGHRGWVYCITLLPDGRLASGSSDKTIRVWNLNTNTCVSTLERHRSVAYCITLLPNSRFASGSSDNMIWIWDLNTNTSVATLEGHTDLVSCIKQLSDGRLASGSHDRTIKLWDLHTNKCFVTLEGHFAEVCCIKQLNENRLASGSSFRPDEESDGSSDEGMIKLWNLNTNECIATLEGHTDTINCIKQLDDARFVSCSSDESGVYFDDDEQRYGWIKVWDLNEIRCIATLKRHLEGVLFIKQLKDGRLVSCSDDETIKLWDLNTNKCIATLEGHTSFVNYIKQLDDGRLASCSGDGTIKVWNLYPDLSFEQIALIVQLERCYQDDNRVNLCDGWRDVFVTLPDYFQKRFQSVVG
ncbi:hypothetical protein JST56_03455 [Candidatus Dependentiae bacterium]|jgi:WD40 repeat protein|nr:hypothetical protein [Candidatus Dependentiae bacterium]